MSSRRTQALKYAEAKELPKLLETLLFQLLMDRPEDHIQYLINRLNEMRLATETKTPSEPAVVVEDTRPSAGGKSSAAETPSGPAPAEKVEENGEPSLTDLLTNSFIVFIAGGPGTGKGTQCKLLADHMHMVHISTGDLLRAALADEKDEKNQHLREIIESGALVPLECVLDLLQKKMLESAKTGANRFLIDGYPRDLEQAKRFDETVGKCSAVIHLKASEDTMIARISKRSRTEARTDDASAIERIKVYQEQTLPVLEYYAPLVKEVDAERSIEQIFNDIKSYLDEMLPKNQ